MRPAVTLPEDIAACLDDVYGALPDPDDLRFAAVIGLLLPREDERGPALVLTERSRSLRAHAGQVALPGGKPDPGDDSLVDTALREASEEVGLPETGTTVLGRLPLVPTPSGFLIVPFVGWAPAGWEPRPTSPEVWRVLTPRLSELADPAIHRVTERGTWRRRPYAMHEFRVHDPPVWGATGIMVHELLVRLGLAERG